MIDVIRQIDAVMREFAITERDGKPHHVQSLTQTYPVPIEDAWDAVSSAERIPQWFLPISGELVLGGRYQLQGNAGGEILECNPPQDGRAGYYVTWEFGGGVTWLSIRLESVDGGTSVTLEHVAEAAGMPTEFWETYGPGATGVGWDGGFLGLSLHLGSVEGALSPQETEAWAATDEGKRFYRRSADKWASAHFASGEDADVAAKAADNTYSFYTGEPA